MIKVLLGPELFRRGMDLYFERHDGEAATIEQFVQCFADVSHRDFTQFMRWYTQAGTPEVVVAPHYDARAKTYRLDITQTMPPTPGQPDKAPMLIPLSVGLVGKDGRDLPLMLDGRSLDRGVIEITKPTQSFVFAGVTERPIPSLNRGFSAPIKLSLPIEPGDLRFLAAQDSDSFNRWQAVQTLAMSLLTANVAALRQNTAPRTDDGLTAALGANLADPNLEPAFIALTLNPPSESDIAREIGRDVDPGAIFVARKHLRATIGEQLGAALADSYERMIVTGPYSPDAASAGKRALKNVCLDLLAATRARRFDRTRVCAVSRRGQHDRSHGRTGDACAARSARAHRSDRGFLRPLFRRSIDHRQMAGAAGGNSRAGDARSGACSYRAPGFFHGQSQSRAVADRIFCAGQPHPVQPRRRRRL